MSQDILENRPQRSARWIPVALLAGAALALPIFAADASAQPATHSAAPPAAAAAVPPAAAQPAAAAPPAAAQPAAAGCLRFVTPGTASAGEQIPLFAYRPRTHQGPLEIRFDGRTLEHRLTRYAAFTVPDVTELFLTVRIPATAAAGRHQLQLHLPSAGPDPLAVSTITLGP
ncbi:hypothetical protein OHA21_52180 [Actinoplanes sp. NBC_00393]|uniref:hypothetical protein n=1 Tax=Actinoplanes sp. NBC_00393 TaxID=2975953 RepID=UPI002E1F311B